MVEGSGVAVISSWSPAALPVEELVPITVQERGAALLLSKMAAEALLAG
jgi:hypothetical protein